MRLAASIAVAVAVAAGAAALLLRPRPPGTRIAVRVETQLADPGAVSDADRAWVSSVIGAAAQSEGSLADELHLRRALEERLRDRPFLAPLVCDEAVRVLSAPGQQRRLYQVGRALRGSYEQLGSRPLELALRSAPGAYLALTAAVGRRATELCRSARRWLNDRSLNDEVGLELRVEAAYLLEIDFEALPQDEQDGLRRDLRALALEDALPVRAAAVTTLGAMGLTAAEDQEVVRACLATSDRSLVVAAARAWILAGRDPVPALARLRALGEQLDADDPVGEFLRAALPGPARP